MSALTPKADMCGATTDVGYGPEADIEVSAKQQDRLAAGIQNPGRIFLSDKATTRGFRFLLHPNRPRAKAGEEKE
jgi:hypothetical protein